MNLVKSLHKSLCTRSDQHTSQEQECRQSVVCERCVQHPFALFKHIQIRSFPHFRCCDIRGHSRHSRPGHISKTLICNAKPPFFCTVTWLTMFEPTDQRLILIAITIGITTRVCVLPLVAARTSVAKRRGERVIDVLLTVETHSKRRDVYHLLSHPAKQDRSYGNIVKSADFKSHGTRQQAAEART